MNKFDPTDTFDPATEIQRLRDDFQPHNLSKKICEAIKTQIDINIILKEIISDAITNDLVMQRIFKTLIKETLREESAQFWFKIIGLIISLIGAFISGGHFLK